MAKPAIPAVAASDRTEIMLRILVCGGRYIGRVPNIFPSNQINARIVQASEEQQQLSAGLREMHERFGIEFIAHFNRRGAERLASHWASIAHVRAKNLQIAPNAPIVKGPEACRDLLRAERITLVLRFPETEFNELGEIEDAATSQGIEVRHVDAANIPFMTRDSTH
jgi:hypothetical protein